MELNPELLKEPTKEQIIYGEVIDLLCEDGWQRLTRDINDCYVFVMDNCGQIRHRYLEWDNEYSEWHNCSFWYPGLWMSERRDLYEDVDDYTEAIVVCTSMPKVTEKTRKAFEILEEYWSSFEE